MSKWYLVLLLFFWVLRLCQKKECLQPYSNYCFVLHLLSMKIPQIYSLNTAAHI